MHQRGPITSVFFRLIESEIPIDFVPVEDEKRGEGNGQVSRPLAPFHQPGIKSLDIGIGLIPKHVDFVGDIPRPEGGVTFEPLGDLGDLLPAFCQFLLEN